MALASSSQTLFCLCPDPRDLGGQDLRWIFKRSFGANQFSLNLLKLLLQGDFFFGVRMQAVEKIDHAG